MLIINLILTAAKSVYAALALYCTLINKNHMRHTCVIKLLFFNQFNLQIFLPSFYLLKDYHLA